VSSEEIVVGVGEMAVVDSPRVLVAVALGSCVALMLYDLGAGVAGLAHIMLPTAALPDPPMPGKYADTAVTAMLDELSARGARKGLILAKLVGGAQMFAPNHEGPAIGERNIRTVTALLKELHIAVVAHEVGGTVARTVEFDTSNAACSIRTALVREPTRI
jgi:chemotaxis protein CheD